MGDRHIGYQEATKLSEGAVALGDINVLKALEAGQKFWITMWDRVDNFYQSDSGSTVFAAFMFPVTVVKVEQTGFSKSTSRLGDSVQEHVRENYALWMSTGETNAEEEHFGFEFNDGEPYNNRVPAMFVSPEAAEAWVKSVYLESLEDLNKELEWAKARVAMKAQMIADPVLVKSDRNFYW